MSENDLNGLQNIDLHIEMSEREKAEQKMMDDAKRAREEAQSTIRQVSNAQRWEIKK